jgi:hypothetical protein
MAMSRSFGATLFTTRPPTAISPLETQQRGFSAARRSDERDELAVVDIDADAVQDLDRTESLADIAYRDGRHGSSPTFLFLRDTLIERATLFSLCVAPGLLPSTRTGLVALTDRSVKARGAGAHSGFAHGNLCPSVN